MILVFEDKKVREKFEKELKGVCVYHRKDAEIFGDKVSSEDYIMRGIIGFSIPFYKEIYRKTVAKKAIEHDFLILDGAPYIPDSVDKCPVIYITNRTEGNDEEFGQLPVQYTGNVDSTIENAQKMLKYWLDKYGEGREEKDFYHDFLVTSDELIPKKLRIIASERVYGNYVAGVTVDFCDSDFNEIIKCIKELEGAGYSVFVDDKVDSYFAIEDIYYTILEAENMESFLMVANILRDKNESLIRDKETLFSAVEERIDRWILEIYKNIYLDHVKERNDYIKIPNGYIQIDYRDARYNLRLEELGIEVDEDDVVFLKLVLDYLEKGLSDLDDEVSVGMYFYGNEIPDDLFD